MATWTVPNDALDLARARVATASVCVTTAVSGTCEVVVAVRSAALLLGLRLLLLLLLLVHLICVQILEQVALLSLIITDIEGVACHVLLLAVEVLDHGQGVVIGALLHRSRITRRLLHTLPKTVLVLDLLAG